MKIDRIRILEVIKFIMSTEPDQINGDDETIELPADTLAILNEFLQSKQEQEASQKKDDLFEEDWVRIHLISRQSTIPGAINPANDLFFFSLLLTQQLSQFWYNENTKRTLSKICLRLILNRSGTHSSSDIKIALLSCPSLYKSIKSVHPNGEVRLFEYDERFSAFHDDYIHYDYNNADKKDYLNEYENYFDIVIADPPFLSEECIRNTSLIINKLKKASSDIILCSGQVVADWVKEFLQLNQCSFRPEHERNLANEFCSYANFELDSYL